MAESAFRGSPPPGGNGPRVYTVIGPTRNEVLDVTFLEERILGLNCHWVVDPVTKKGRTRACLDFEGECPLCEKCPKTWVGFVGVYHHIERQRMVLRVGPEGARQIARWANRGEGLRGVRLLIKTSTEGRMSSLDVRQSETVSVMPLPPAHDIMPTVCLVLGVQQLPEYRRGADELTGPVESDEQGGVS